MHVERVDYEMTGITPFGNFIQASLSITLISNCALLLSHAVLRMNGQIVDVLIYFSTIRLLLEVYHCWLLVKCSGAFSACFACPNVVFMMPHIIGISNVTETCSKFSEILLCAKPLWTGQMVAERRRGGGCQGRRKVEVRVLGGGDEELHGGL
jgi:hypothetical protein